MIRQRPWEKAQSGMKDSAENGKSVKKSSDILIVSDINSANETIRVYNYSTGVQYQYYYGLTTGFFDKYGNHMSVSDIHQGDVVDISGADSDGKAKRIQKSDKVWTNDAVTNFSVDKNNSVLEIGNSSYRLGERTMIFSGSDVIDTDSLTAQDKLAVVGIDKDIVSISGTAHCSLAIHRCLRAAFCSSETGYLQKSLRICRLMCRRAAIRSLWPTTAGEAARILR